MNSARGKMKYGKSIVVLWCIASLAIIGCASRRGMEEVGTEEFHRRVGERLEVLYATEIENHYENLAYHYSRSGNKEKAIHYLIKLGAESKAVYANKQAVEYYEQALKLFDEAKGMDLNMRGHIYLCLAEIELHTTRDYEKSLEFADKALGFSTGKNQRAKSYWIMGAIHGDTDHDLAIKYQNQAIAELGDDTESAEMLQILISLFWPTLYSGHTNEAMEIVQQGIEAGERTENYFALAHLYICLLWVNMERSYGIQDMDKGFEYAEKSLEAAQKSGDLHCIGHSSFWVGWAHMQKGEYDIAAKFMKEAIDVYKKTGHNYHLRQAYSWLSGIYLRKGDQKGFRDMTNSVIER